MVAESYAANGQCRPCGEACGAREDGVQSPLAEVNQDTEGKGCRHQLHAQFVEDVCSLWACIAVVNRIPRMTAPTQRLTARLRIALSESGFDRIPRSTPHAASLRRPRRPAQQDCTWRMRWQTEALGKSVQEWRPCIWQLSVR
jgi:hypothetical protein